MPKCLVFISYAHQDEAWAKWVAWQIEAVGHTTEMMPWDSGIDFAGRMDKALKKCSLTLAILTPAYLRSEFCKKEYLTALVAGIEGKRRSLVLLRVEKCKPKGLLRTNTYCDLVGITDEQKACRMVLKAVDGVPAKSRLPPPFPFANPTFPAAKHDPPEPRTELKELLFEYRSMVKVQMACRDSLRRLSDEMNRVDASMSQLRDRVCRLADGAASWLDAFRRHFKYKPPIPPGDQNKRNQCGDCLRYYALDSADKDYLEESLRTVERTVREILEPKRSLRRRYDALVTAYHRTYDDIIDLALWPHGGNRARLNELTGEEVVVARTAEDMASVVADSPRGRYLQARSIEHG